MKPQNPVDNSEINLLFVQKKSWVADKEEGVIGVILQLEDRSS